MKFRKDIYILTALLLMMFLSGCSESDSLLSAPMSDNPDIIHIGGIDNADMETSLSGFTTRAIGEEPTVDAETIDWLLGPLFGGLDITYGAKGQEEETQNVAILKLLKKDETGGNTKENIKYSDYIGPNGEKIAEYSFKYLEQPEFDAKWYDNGEHYFQGVFVPENLRFKGSETVENVNDPTNGKAKNLKYDQSKDVKTDANANYTLLERYLGMPADAYIHATVGRVKLPFRHRLARVVAYVLIDPTMGDDVTINGYKKDAEGNPQKDADNNPVEDATTSDIRFCDVKVLAGVKEAESDVSGHSTLTPIWDQARKVIPHFIEERTSMNSEGEVIDAENFIMFYNKELKTYIFPANDAAWNEAKTEWEKEYTKALGSEISDEAKRSAANAADENSNFKRTLYGKVPCYDIIVRPTYKSEEMVMYDEENYATKKEELASISNIIDFEITLNNGLQYYKEFKFDLDANYQTIVYLRISRESIDYNSSGAEIWQEDAHTDGYYGVNNQNGNTLSFAGSSWQRAYRFSSKDVPVTDGHYYGKDDNTDADDDVMPNYPQYVSQAQWIEIFAEAHEGGLHHGDYFILDNDITIDATKLPDNFVFTGHLDGQDHTITLINGGTSWDEPHYTYDESTNYDASKLYVMKDAEYVEFHLPQLYTYTPAVTYTKETAATENASHQEKDENGDPKVDKDNNPVYPDGYTPVKEGDIIISESWNPASPTLAEVKNGYSIYYVKKDDETSYEAYKADYTFYEYVNHPIPHTSGTTLFAGLNGAYAATKGEANVHEETQNDHTILVPYVDATSKTGWRAEVINTKVKGADMFPASATKDDGSYDVDNISGYIFNCWKIEGDNMKTTVKSHTPTLPKYK